MNQIPSTKTDYAVDFLKRSLLRGEIRPGDPISISAVAERLGISATPVREAIRILQAEGFITKEAHKTGTASHLSPSESAGLYLLRGRLEGLAARLATPNLNPEDIVQLKRLESEMEAALENRDSDTFSVKNTDWHFVIYNASDLTWLSEFIVRLWSLVPWRDMWAISKRYDEALRQHRAVRKAIEAGDPDLAEREMSEHIQSGYETLEDLLSKRGTR